MDYIGIDIGSTASKVVVKGDHDIHFVLPTGWSSKETCQTIKDRLLEDSVDVLSDDSKVVATGYGRVAVDFADHVITEITCHARGGREMAGDECAIIDVGGQDTKIILVSGGMVQDFQMNDKCSAGTGKILEIMANRLGVRSMNYLIWRQQEKLFRSAHFVRYLPNLRSSTISVRDRNGKILPPVLSILLPTR